MPLAPDQLRHLPSPARSPRRTAACGRTRSKTLLGQLLQDRRARVLDLVLAVAEAHDLVLASRAGPRPTRARVSAVPGCSRSMSSTSSLAPPCSGPDSVPTAADDHRVRVGQRRAGHARAERRGVHRCSACRISAASMTCARPAARLLADQHVRSWRRGRGRRAARSARRRGGRGGTRRRWSAAWRSGGSRGSQCSSASLTSSPG